METTAAISPLQMQQLQCSITARKWITSSTEMMKSSRSEMKLEKASGRRSSVERRASSFRSDSANLDEETLTHWAAIDRLPTFERLRSSLFDEDDGRNGKRVVDVAKIGAPERHLFIEKLIKHIEHDNLKLLHKIRKRTDKVGVKNPTIEVRYTDLRVAAECQVVYGKPLPTLWNSFTSLLLDVTTRLPCLPSQDAHVDIINDVSGIIKPGRMTLLLGPPGCGKSTLLKALSGNLDKSLKVTGDVEYNGYKLDEFVPQKTSAYISQHDLHIPEMTVRETLDFSARCQGIGTRAESIMEVSRREKQTNIVKHIEHDNLKLLHKIRKRTDKVGVKNPTIEVRYTDLRVVAECQVVYGKPLPTLWNSFTSLLLDVTTRLPCLPSQDAHVDIINDVSGIIKPGRMTLLLGPPGCGKTTLLKTLSGNLDKSLKVTGDIEYNGYKLDEFVPQKTSAYISQHDLHIPEMTVRETLDFSARCQGIGSRAESIMEVSRREKQTNIVPDPDIDTYMKAISVEGQKSTLQTDYILKILGLDICADTLFGDAMRRGISGGQKKRLTTGEMIVGPTKALFMDEISNGLDSSTTYQIVSCLQQLAHITDATILVSLLQPAPETFDLFDDIILMGEGKIVYHGPRSDVLEFFGSCGFRCPERKGVADFLQEVISRKDQEQYWHETDQPSRYTSVDMFSKIYKSSVHGKRLSEEISFPFDKPNSQKNGISFSVYSLPKWTLFRACMSREFLLMKRNSFTYIFKSVQRDLEFYPAWAYAIPATILKIPVSLLEAIIWTSLTYYVIGFTPEAGRFFRQMLVVFVVHTASLSLFRLLASIFRNVVASTTAGSLTVLFTILFSGFLIPRPSMPGWLKWAFWLSPLSYGEIGLSYNEFLAPRWQKEMVGNTTLGNQILENRGLNFDRDLFWVSVGALFGLTLLFNIGFALALSYLKPSGSRAIISSDQLSKLRGSKESEPSKDSTPEKSHKDRMVLPFEPLSIVFQGVQYYVETPVAMKEHGFTEKKLQLLCDITAAFRPGVLTALMGVSGAGKTTLLDVLCGRKTSGTMEGEIRIGGYPKVQSTFARISGYCEQTDIHSPQITVEESVIFSAWLRLDPHIETKTKYKFVKQVLQTIELDGIKDALVGLPDVDGLSAEQRKRLTIAVELVANPSIIFMDEPTTGLDARAAAIVMRAVKNVANTGRTIVCTIHQPSIDIFEAFDELLLKAGGRMSFCGPLGQQSSKVIEYFEGIPGVPKIRDNYNPAAWMLEVTSTTAEAELGIDFADIYNKSTLHENNNEVVRKLSNPPSGSKDMHFPTQYAQNGWGQFKACLWKQHLSYWRSPNYNLTRSLQMLFAAFLFGVLFWDQGKKIHNQQSLFTLLGSMYFSAQFCGINNSSSVLPYVSKERTVLYRERFAGMYASWAYSAAQVIIEIPYLFAQAVAYTVITYPMIGYYWTANKVFWYFYAMFCTLLYFTYLGMMLVSVTPSFQIAAISQTTFYTMFNLFAGFLIPHPVSSFFTSNFHVLLTFNIQTTYINCT